MNDSPVPSGGGCTRLLGIVLALIPALIGFLLFMRGGFSEWFPLFLFINVVFSFVGSLLLLSRLVPDVWPRIFVSIFAALVFCVINIMVTALAACSYGIR